MISKQGLKQHRETGKDEECGESSWPGEVGGVFLSRWKTHHAQFEIRRCLAVPLGPGWSLQFALWRTLDWWLKWCILKKNKEVKSALESKTVCRDFIKIIFLSNGDREAGKLTAMLKSLRLLFSLVKQKNTGAEFRCVRLLYQLHLSVFLHLVLQYLESVLCSRQVPLMWGNTL